MRGQADPTELLRDSLEAYFAGQRGGRPVYLALLAAVAGALAALPLVQVDVTARARGLLRPAIERHRVAAGAAGIVRAVHVRVGDTVEAGHLLISLRTEDVDRQLAASDSSSAEVVQRSADLSSLILQAGSLVDGNAGGVGRVALLRYRQELQRLRQEWADLREEAMASRRDAARAEALGRLGLAASAEIEQLILRRDRAAAAPRLLAQRQRTAWAAELQQVLSERRRLEVERAQLLESARLREIRAPVTGTLEALSPLSPGSWVAAGEEVSEVSPRAPLVAEIYVESRDIGRVRPGMPVRLLVDAFDHHEWGALPARVAAIAGDYTTLDGRPVFRVRCALLREWLRGAGGHRRRPGKGMGVTASFVMDRRSLFHLLWDRTGTPEDIEPPAEGR